jgi:hypothetical protein
MKRKVHPATTSIFSHITNHRGDSGTTSIQIHFASKIAMDLLIERLLTVVVAIESQWIRITESSDSFETG